jgi:hypothetical protein
MPFESAPQGSLKKIELDLLLTDLALKRRTMLGAGVPVSVLSLY